MKDDRLPGAQQESLLTLLCFDKEAAAIVNGVIDVSLFDSDIYRDIADRAMAFYELYREPIAEHLPDEFASILEGDDNKKAQLYERTIASIWESKDSVNKEYVINRLEDFIGRQIFKRAVTEASKIVQSGGDLEKAREVMRKADKNHIKLFHPGTSLIVPDQDYASFIDMEDQFMKIGITGFEEPTVRFGPDRKTLMTLLSGFGKGKTWFLVQAGRYCAQQRAKVLHVTLEMSEEKTKMRYIQNILSLSKYEAKVVYHKLNIDEEDNFKGLDDVEVERPTFKSRGVKSLINSRMRKLRLPIVIKEFPTSHLTMSGLEAYLDGMERFHNYIPDILIVDYADLMKADAANLRTDLSQNFKALRGLCVDRNMGGITVAQSNRLGEDVRVLTTKYLAEDYTKTATSDMIATMSQMRNERELGLARIWVAKNRDNEDNKYYLISTSYKMGQFCVDCSKVPNGYFDFLEKKDDNSKKRD